MGLPQKRNRLLIIAGVLAVLLLAAGGYGYSCVRSTTSNSEPVRINLAKTDNPLAARDTLTGCQIISNETKFNLIADLLKLDEGWKAGSYVVEPHTSVYRLVKRIVRGQQDPLRLTLGKFRTPQQLNDYLNRKLMHDDFNVTLDSFHLIRPNTYEFYWTVSPEQFMKRMDEEYARFWNKKTGEEGKLRADLLEGAAPDESTAMRNTVILASIIEEETNNNGEKPLIASVYLNRLERGMPLQADPTVKYAVGDFTLRRILNKHLAAESPFNTYLHTGLPPAPICLPSDASIDAVLNAKKTRYLYFCASEKMDGTHRFAATLGEHNRNAARFHSALNAKGIR